MWGVGVLWVRGGCRWVVRGGEVWGLGGVVVVWGGLGWFGVALLVI